MCCYPNSNRRQNAQNMVYLFVNAPEISSLMRNDVDPRPKRPACKSTPRPNTGNTWQERASTESTLKPDLPRNPTPRNRLRKNPLRLPQLPRA
jgi:hypothetical protein